MLLSGGPSHIDTFDLKEGAWTPSFFEPETYGGIRWPRGLMPPLRQLGWLAGEAHARVPLLAPLAERYGVPVMRGIVR